MPSLSKCWEIFINKLKNSLDWYGKNQKRVWLGGIVFMMVWAAYDTGNIVAQRKIEEMPAMATSAMTMSEMENYIKEHEGGVLFIQEDNVIYTAANENKVSIIKDFKEKVNQETLNYLKDHNVKINGSVKINIIKNLSSSKEIALAIILDVLLKVVLFSLYMIIVLFLFKQFRQMKLTSGGIGSKRFKKVSNEHKSKFKIADVAGHEGPKKEVMEIVEYLREPERFNKTGAKPPKGVLLYGPPGNGKTLLAKAIAGEADATFLEQAASSFVQLYVGAGSLAVTQLFEEARKNKPCVIFIDEIDALGGSRAGMNSSDERLQTVNALLSQMDGFENNDGIVVIAATNRVEELDEALIRPGRFDRKVKIPLPTRNDRLEILNLHAKKIPNLSANLEHWADQTKGFSGAELSALVNEAAIEATRVEKDKVTDEEFSLARDRVMIGTKHHNVRTSDRDKKFVAYHELGHAVARILNGGDVEKISIQPRGMSLGVTVSIENNEDTFLQTEDEIYQEIKILLAGRASEKIFCGAISGASADDMARASEIAREAIRRYGFDENGPYVPKYDLMLKEVEEKSALWLNKAYIEIMEKLKENEDSIHKLFEILIKEEVIKGEIIKEYLNK